MKKRLMLSLFAGVLMAVMLPVAALGAVEVNARDSIVGEVFDDICGEELTHTAGDLHMVISATENDNRISGGYHFNPQGAKLEDEAGRVYSGTGVGRGHFSEPVDGNGAVTFTAVDSFKLIGHGSAPNFLLQAVFHVTINANGDVTVEFERVSEQCK